MDAQKLTAWVQAVTSIAIVIGLALVVWELQQNREATQSQLTTEGWHMMNQFHTSVLGEQPAEVLAKSCDAPDTLTTADFIILDHYFSELLSHRTLRLKSLSERGSFFSSEYWKTVPGWYWIFSTPAGRAWWRWASPGFDAEIRAVGNEAMSNRRWLDCDYSEWGLLISEERKNQTPAPD